jgi:DNA mismatch repair ATPase MutL
MAFCGKCGSEIGNENVFCPKCGALQEGQGDPNEQQPINQYSSQSTQQPNQSYNQQPNQSYNQQSNQQYNPQYNQYNSYGNHQPYQSQQPVDNTGILIWSILTTLFCCVPLGIVGIVFSSQAKNATTDEEAQKKLKDAKLMCIIGDISGVIILIVSLITGVLGNLMYY